MFLNENNFFLWKKTATHLDLNLRSVFSFQQLIIELVGVWIVVQTQKVKKEVKHFKTGNELILI